MVKMQNNGQPPEPRRCFSLTCINDLSNAQINDLEDKIKELGARVFKSELLYDKLTHVVVCSKKPSYSTKIMCAMASGVWIVSEEYVLQSAKSGKWLYEDRYALFTSSLKIRTLIQTEGHIFRNMTAAIIMSDENRRLAYRSVIRAGGGIVKDHSFRALMAAQPEIGDLNYIILDSDVKNSNHPDHKDYLEFVEYTTRHGFQISYLHFMFILDSLKAARYVSTESYDLNNRVTFRNTVNVRAQLKSKNKRSAPIEEPKGIKRPRNGKQVLEVDLTEDDDSDCDVEILEFKYLEEKSRNRGMGRVYTDKEVVEVRPTQSHATVCEKQRNELGIQRNVDVINLEDSDEEINIIEIRSFDSSAESSTDSEVETISQFDPPAKAEPFQVYEVSDYSDSGSESDSGDSVLMDNTLTGENADMDATTTTTRYADGGPQNNGTSPCYFIDDGSHSPLLSDSSSKEAKLSSEEPSMLLPSQTTQTLQDTLLSPEESSFQSSEKIAPTTEYSPSKLLPRKNEGIKRHTRTTYRPKSSSPGPASPRGATSSPDPASSPGHSPPRTINASLIPQLIGEHDLISSGGGGGGGEPENGGLMSSGAAASESPQPPGGKDHFATSHQPEVVPDSSSAPATQTSQISEESSAGRASPVRVDRDGDMLYKD